MGAFEPTKTKLLFIVKGKLNWLDENNQWQQSSAWKGYVTDIQFRHVTPTDTQKPPYEAINITVNDGKEVAIITCKFNTGYGRAMAKTLPNCDFSKEVAFIPNYKEEGAKKEGTVFLQQGGSPVKWAFTRENPNGCPPPKEVDTGEKKIYIFTDQILFLKDMLLNNVVPRLNAAIISTPAPVSEPAWPAAPPPPENPKTPISAQMEAESEDDDLPF